MPTDLTIPLATTTSQLFTKEPGSPALRPHLHNRGILRLGDVPDRGTELLDAVLRVRPRLHVFGHIHGAGKIVTSDDTNFVNAALPGVDSQLQRAPIVLDYPDDLAARQSFRFA